MSEYLRVLEGTEQHLRALKASGVRFLNITSETLTSLTESPPSISENTIRINGQTDKNGGESNTRFSPPFPKAEESGDFKGRAETVIPSYDGLNSKAKNDGENRTQELPGKNVGKSSDLSVSEGVIQSYDSAHVASGMDDLRQRASACLKCPHLVKSRKNVVFGVGDIRARLMFVGEAPGADEDAQGEPFVGAAGQLLTRIIQTMGLSRETVYIANILKCRPDTPGQSFGNRKPTPDEMKTCLPYLLAQIDLIRPKVMVALGSTAVEGLIGKCESIGRIRGKFHVFREIPLMPTFHPAYLLRNQALTEKRKVWEDMLQVMSRLEMPISEKQKSYFLKQ